MKDPGGRRHSDSMAGGTASARFERLFGDHHLLIARYAQRRVADDAVADVVAEVFTVAWRRLGDIGTPELPWLYQVAHHVIANSARRRRREAEFLRDWGCSLITVPGDDTAFLATARVAAAAAFGRLAESDREVLALVAWEGLGLGDLAATLGISPGAAAVRVHRARNRLQDALTITADPHPVSLEAARD